MELIRELAAVGGVLLLLGAVLWWLRRKGVAQSGGGGGRVRSLQVVERAALAPQHSLCLVRLAGRGLLVGVSPAGSTVLERFEWDSLERPARAAEAGR